MDLSSIGGTSGARVTGTAVQHISATGEQLCHWSPFDHLAITDGDPRDLAGADVNWTHGNSLDLASDERRLTARLVRSYGSAPGVVTQIGGSVQDLPGGRTLVSFGTAGRVEEYDGNGHVVWRIEQGAGYVFRAQRISSLYAPGVGGTR